MTDGEITRAEQALIALHDYGSRAGATARKIMANMRAAGFTEAEISAAATTMHGEHSPKGEAE